jgi:protein-S-isoprenylcysteine O-methyltransferase Ste14
MVLAALLLALPPHRLPGVLNDRFLPRGALFPWLGTLLVAAGLGLASWARVHLGRNWSGTVTLKEGHTLVVSGPYGVVRHPIYTGLLFAFLGTALAIGEWRGLAAFALALFAFLYKSRAEEARMRETFPQYADYRRRTKALLPFIY